MDFSMEKTGIFWSRNLGIDMDWTDLIHNYTAYVEIMDYLRPLVGGWEMLRETPDKI